MEKHINREWFYGSLNDIKGMFPSSFVEVIIDVPFQEELIEVSEERVVFIVVKVEHTLFPLLHLLLRLVSVSSGTTRTRLRHC